MKVPATIWINFFYCTIVEGRWIHTCHKLERLGHELVLVVRHLEIGLAKNGVFRFGATANSFVSGEEVRRGDVKPSTLSSLRAWHLHKHGLQLHNIKAPIVSIIP